MQKKKKLNGRKFFLGIILAVLFSFGLALPGLAANNVKLVIDQKNIDVSPLPIIRDGRTLVPVRVVSESLGANVNWDEQNRTVHIVKGNKAVLLRIDNRLVDFTDGGSTTFSLCDVPPMIIDNRTFVPLRLVSNALGVGVHWKGESRTVIVDSGISVPFSPFFDVTIPTVQAGQNISGLTTLQLGTATTLPAGAQEVRFQLLDPRTGRGPVIARGNNITALYSWLPDPIDTGLKVLAGAVYDHKGNFLAGTAIPVQIAVVPQLSLTGVSHGQVIEGNAQIGVATNFLAHYVKYEITNLGNGKVTVTDEVDPQGPYVWAPEVSDNGSYNLRAIAYDALGRAYSSPTITVTVDVKPTLALRGVSAGVVDKPVTLWVWRNFPITQVEYILKDVNTGREMVLAQSGYSSFNWFPGPELAGSWEVFGRVKDTRGVTHATQPIPIQVMANPKLNLIGVGPNQVLTDTVKVSSRANVSLIGIEYRLLSTEGGLIKVIAGGPDVTTEYTWSPKEVSAGYYKIQAVGFTSSGEEIVSEEVPVRVYHGQIYGPVPIIEKDRFKDFAAQLAVKSQEKTGMSAALQTAQAILETGWGQSTPADKYTGKPSNNLFGIKGKGPAGSVISNTWEEYNGTTFRIDAEFRAYSNPEESWEDHKALLLTSSRYEPYRQVMHNSTLGAWALKRAGYATDSKYPLKLIDIIKRYDLHLLDEKGI